MLSSKLSVLLFIGISTLLIANVHGGKGKGLGLSKLVLPSDETINARHGFKPASQEDKHFMKEVYHSVTNLDGSVLDAPKVEKKKKKKKTSMTSKILFGESAEENIERQAFKDPVTPQALQQLTKLYQVVSDGVVVPDRLDHWTLPYGVVKPDAPKPSNDEALSDIPENH
ncbi:uncharacterized protein LOC116341140 [Contarinia nasturtii]|uniref:uncharacterized protein LOC116341140 n=1 Tax=Contarinia nasturtii TaxID=265458 RepID=UPI0012D3B72A|nr:uncharacterized protein LOC116341140 [Contarinia nasturtii]